MFYNYLIAAEQAPGCRFPWLVSGQINDDERMVVSMIFDIGDTAYILEDLVNPRAVTVQERTGNMYTVKIENSDTIRVRQTRLFASLEEARRNSIRLERPLAQERADRLPLDFGLKIWRSGKGVRF